MYGILKTADRRAKGTNLGLSSMYLVHTEYILPFSVQSHSGDKRCISIFSEFDNVVLGKLLVVQGNGPKFVPRG